MKRWAFAILFALTPFAATADAPDESEMVIDAGRLGVMMDQSQEILGLPNAAVGDADASTETPAVLRDAVRQYQRLLPVACAKHAVADTVCERAYYAPGWLTETAAPSPAVLRARIDEAQDRIASLWSGLCAKLPKDHDESLCQME